MTSPSRGTRPTCREPRSLPEHPRTRFPRLRLGGFDNTPGIHLAVALQRRLPVALTPWVGRPSEGRVLLGGVHAFPSSATPVHPFVTGWSSMGLGDVPTSETEPIETHALWHPREEEPRRVDQGTFRRQHSARTPG